MASTGSFPVIVEVPADAGRLDGPPDNPGPVETATPTPTSPPPPADPIETSTPPPDSSDPTPDLPSQTISVPQQGVPMPELPHTGGPVLSLTLLGLLLMGLAVTLWRLSRPRRPGATTP